MRKDFSRKGLAASILAAALADIVFLALRAGGISLLESAAISFPVCIVGGIFTGIFWPIYPRKGASR